MYIIVVVVVAHVVYVTLQLGRTVSPNAASIINNQSTTTLQPLIIFQPNLVLRFAFKPALCVPTYKAIEFDLFVIGL